VDWYALGVLIFEMLSGLPPYYSSDADTNSENLLYESIMRGPTHIKFPAAVNADAMDLILKLMEIDPSKRYGNLQRGAGDIFAHPWFNEVKWEKIAPGEIKTPFVPPINGQGDASA
jgi:protein kinase A